MAAATRRAFVRAAVAPLLPAACTQSPPGKTNEARPNILFVIADDQSWLHCGAYGARQVATPAFDRVAREGVLFRNAFSACPSCTPSRSAVLSGRHVWQQREAGVLYGSMPADLPLYPHLLEDAGYFAGHTGKGWAPGDWKALGLTRNPCGREYSARQHTGPVPAAIDPTDYAGNFEEFLKERPGGVPFCFWLGSREPHRLYDPGIGLRSGKQLSDAAVPPFLPDTEVVRSDLLDYYAEIEWFDRQLGRTLGVLEAQGELDRTLIVVTSDNGMPFPRAKVNLYDWGTHMPLAIRWGKRIPAGRVVDDLVSHVDFAPTFLEAAGVTPPSGIAGQSLLPLLAGRPSPAARNAVFTAMERHTMCRPEGATYPMRAIRTKEFLYIRNSAPERWPTGGEFLSSNRTTHGDIDGAPTKDVLLAPDARKKYPGAVRLCLHRRPEEELYEVAADPGQVRNLAVERPAVARQLRAQLEAYLHETGDPRQRGEDPWQGYVYRQTTGFGASFNTSLPDAVRKAAREAPQHKPE